MLVGHLHPRRDADAAARGARPSSARASTTLALPWVHSGEHRSARFAAWAERLWQRPLALRRRSPSSILRRARVAGARPQDRACRRSRSSRPPTARASATPRSSRPSARAPPARSRSPPASATPAGCSPIAKADPGIARVMPAIPGAGRPPPSSRPSPTPTRPSKAVGATVDRLRAALPQGALVGGCGRREPRPRAAPVRQDAAGHRRRPRARLPAAARRAAGADHRRRRACSPTCSPPAPRSASPG